MTNNDDNKGSNNPPTANDVRVLRQYAEKFETSNAVPVLEAASNTVPLAQEIADMEEPVDKEQRVHWSLWDVGLDMPQHQRAILKMFSKIPLA
ncbi:hypothetical protein N7535_001948 [Penicillium sp. DV-2018c]|nr:hypothetical protein N7535_001948 [Penicillium sp. DV-2018c]